MTQPKNVLIALGKTGHFRSDWIYTLREGGFSFVERHLDTDLASGMANANVKLRQGDVEVHIVGSPKLLTEAVTANTYDVAFIPDALNETPTDASILDLLTLSQAKVVLISRNSKAHAETLRETMPPEVAVGGDRLVSGQPSLTSGNFDHISAVLNDKERHRDMTQPKKVLIAEDDIALVEIMIRELQKSGFDLDAATPGEILAIIDSPTGIGKITYDENEVYFVSCLEPLEDAVNARRYDMVMLDGLLADDEGTYEVAQCLLAKEKPPLLVLISSALNAQFDILERRMGSLRPYRMREVLEGGLKNPFYLAGRVREFLGIEEPPEPVRERKKKPEPPAEKPQEPKNVLIAISDSDLRRDWIESLQQENVDVGEDVLMNVDRYAVLTYGNHTIYFVGGVAAANEIVSDKPIDLAFIDDRIDGDHLCGLSRDDDVTDGVIKTLLEKTKARVVVIARDSHAHCERIRDDVDYRLTEGRLIAGGRKYKKNRTYLANLLGFRKAGAPVVKPDPWRKPGCCM